MKGAEYQWTTQWHKIPSMGSSYRESQESGYEEVYLTLFVSGNNFLKYEQDVR